MKTFVVLALYLFSLKTVKGDITGGSFFKNRFLMEDAIRVYEKVGPKQCVRLCMYNKDCKAINFRTNQLKCTQLRGNIDGDIQEHLSNEHEVDFTFVKGWTQKEDSCWPVNPCRNQQQCVPSNMNKPICTNYNMCSPGWKFFDDHCYYFEVTDSWTWEEAKNACETNGAYLVKVDNGPEYDWISTNIQREVWIGANDINLEGNFTWVSDNSTVIFSMWESGEPNDYNGDEDCGAMLISGFWNDFSCQWSKSYVCEK